LTEMAHGYGFLAVFVAALSLRAMERHHDYHDRLHDFIEQMERLVMMVLLVLFGGAIASGLFAPLDWSAAVFAAGTLLIVRPLAGWIGLLGFPGSRLERWVMAFYGIRGIGSAYYLAYALNAEVFEASDYLWAVIGLVMLISIILHGTTVTPCMTYLDRVRRKASGSMRQALTATPEPARPQGASRA
jgi:sodium/hydrogen antiporter